MKTAPSNTTPASLGLDGCNISYLVHHGINPPSETTSDEKFKLRKRRDGDLLERDAYPQIGPVLPQSARQRRQLLLECTSIGPGSVLKDSSLRSTPFRLVSASWSCGGKRVPGAVPQLASPVAMQSTQDASVAANRSSAAPLNHQ